MYGAILISGFGWGLIFAGLVVGGVVLYALLGTGIARLKKMIGGS